MDRLVREAREMIRRAGNLLESLVKSEQSVMLESIELLNEALLTGDRDSLKNCISDMGFLLEQMEETTEPVS
jgi:hypothetical protein